MTNYLTNRDRPSGRFFYAPVLAAGAGQKMGIIYHLVPFCDIIAANAGKMIPIQAVIVHDGLFADDRGRTQQAAVRSAL